MLVWLAHPARLSTPFLPFIPIAKPTNPLPPPSYLQTYHPRQQNPILDVVAILFFFVYNKIFNGVIMSQGQTCIFELASKGLLRSIFGDLQFPNDLGCLKVQRQ